ncbi:mannose-1-phosphate guanylyltransferase/mannose-6-phosphate isomerase [Sphingomonas colocasiae]|uniref:Mannose-1-phosphate guanylyltransferase/mannose-6-phosphate isomerase n=1 Tax=Sphingomonas colocasiae TaxID=1848973 RepID=A0ABS7PTN3_9SPHN|nr:mannose-1-phosphate guanylyltransferase/mannose-6-phosphate isomerase [Sphingomonas colocasiae]MBY8824682.1 mannose-1-phosphate guanylyltransferase/mannose-6-phosphate isomerase [Sphingomonas colocasiae]
MNSTRIVPVILSGGSGTRLWPMSRPETPKQLLALTAEETMLQLTARRTLDEARFDPPIIVANDAHADTVETQLAKVGVVPQALILEPVGRNTAPAIALAAIAADPASPLLVMPSDHVITDHASFRRAIEAALPLAEDGWLVTFGISPDKPETGYGYIETGEALAPGVHRVARFVEKPDRATAEAMLAAGGHAWNGGIFLFRADIFLDALSAHAPAMLASVQAAMRDAERDGGRIHPHAGHFAESPSDSIDYAVMEKAERVAVVPVDMGWSDLGSWDALHALSRCDASDNACDGNAILIDSHNCLVRSDGPRIALVGVDDLIVVASGNDILILPRGRSQDVRKVTDHLKEEQK